MFEHFGIRQKVFVLFTIVALTPLVIVNIIWLRSSQQQLKQAAASRQSILLGSIAQRVDESLDAKIDAVVTNSQDSAVTNLDLAAAKIKLLQYANQDVDIRRISLVDDKGDERIVIKDGESINEFTNIKASPEFDVVNLLGNQASLGDVTFDGDEPLIIISVPLLNVKLGSQDLTSAQALARRYGSDINGALVVQISLQSLWKTVTNAKLGTDGYVFLVNDHGDVIAHKNATFHDTKKNLIGVAEVKDAVKTLSSFDLDTVVKNYQPDPSVTDSENGVKVLSSNFPISQTKWAVIGVEPVASVYSASNRASAIALIILLISVPISVFFVILATRNIINPIRELTKDALRMGAGDFGTHLEVKGHDELATMATTFNKMGDDLQHLLNRLQEQNLVLAAERAKLQAVLDTIADGVIALDRNFNVLLLNKTIVTLTSHQDTNGLLGRPWLEVFSVQQDGQPFNNEIFKDELQYFHDLTIKSGDDQKYIDVTAIKLHNDTNGIAYIMTIHDITQRRELENMRLDFVSMAAHELRTPLTALNGYLDLIAKNHTDPAKNEIFIKQASGNAAMLDNLISNLLSLSHIERNALKLNMKSLNWNKVVVEEIENHRFAAEAKRLTLTYSLPDTPVEVWGDEYALREVVGNLVGNSIHYTNAGGTILVTVTHSDAGVTTTVTDNGIGIPPNAIDKIFIKYFRAEGGLTTNSQGTGIGLYICKTIVTAHKGTIGVKSEYGKGSDFYFTLPPADKAVKEQPMSSTPTMNERSKVDWF